MKIIEIFSNYFLINCFHRVTETISVPSTVQSIGTLAGLSLPLFVYQYFSRAVPSTVASTGTLAGLSLPLFEVSVL